MTFPTAWSEARVTVRTAMLDTHAFDGIFDGDQIERVVDSVIGAVIAKPAFESFETLSKTFVAPTIIDREQT